MRTCLQFLWCDTIGSRRTTKIIFTQKTVFSYLMGYPGAKAFVATYYCSICSLMTVVWFLSIPSTASFAKDETILLAIYCSLQFGTIICVNHDSYLFPATSNSYSLLSIFLFASYTNHRDGRACFWFCQWFLLVSFPSLKGEEGKGRVVVPSFFASCAWCDSHVVNIN